MVADYRVGAVEDLDSMLEVCAYSLWNAHLGIERGSLVGNGLKIVLTYIEQFQQCSEFNAYKKLSFYTTRLLKNS